MRPEAYRAPNRSVAACRRIAYQGAMCRLPRDVMVVAQLARVAAEAMGAQCRVEHLEALNEVKVAFCDGSKAERIFGKREHTALKDGIGRMADWAKAHGTRQSRVFQNFEVTKNLPPSWPSAISRVA